MEEKHHCSGFCKADVEHELGVVEHDEPVCVGT